MELAEALRADLERLLAAGCVEVRENGARLAALESFRYEVRQQGNNVLLHLWSQERNLVRRVVRLTDEAPNRLSLEVARLGRPRSDRLEFVGGGGRRQRTSGRVARESFREHFRDLLADRFPDEEISSLTTAADLEHSLSGNYTRGVMGEGSRTWAVLGAAPGEAAGTYDGMLTFGLLWLQRARESARRKMVAGLRLFSPEGESRMTAHRLSALGDTTAVELYEYNEQSWRVRQLDPADVGNLESRLMPRREIEAFLTQAGPEIDRMRCKFPDAVDAQVASAGGHVVLRFRGLIFARLRDGGVYYGLDDPGQLLTPESQPDLERLLGELETHRSPLSSATQHPLYRAQPERWLESLVAADATRVDARLDPRFLYRQVPAFSSADRGVMDLLGVTRTGRLAVVELKASEDIHLVLQAADYWLRVRAQHVQENFHRYGYFPGVALDPRPPLLFLVAPSIRFHPATEVLLKFLTEEIEVCRVGVSENWRRGLKVALRQGSN